METAQGELSFCSDAEAAEDLKIRERENEGINRGDRVQGWPQTDGGAPAVLISSSKQAGKEKPIEAKAKLVAAKADGKKLAPLPDDDLSWLTGRVS